MNILQVRKCLTREERLGHFAILGLPLGSRHGRPYKINFWSSLFLGNGQGRVIYGPFANWTTPAEGRYLQRNIG